MDLLRDLNDQQRLAVEHTEGPLLVLAGAGSGKTRVLVYRVAHLLHTGRADASEIFAVTFTNKAAYEMKERVTRLLGERETPSRVGTFHALCLRILRREAGRLGYGEGFQVFDTDDSQRLVKECMKEASLDDSQTTAREILRRISAAKNGGVSPEDAAGHFRGNLSLAYARAYQAYQEGLRRMNAMDFDDLILNVLRLFDDHPERRDLWAGACRYLLVDEYQDTNPPQYRLVKALSSSHGNLCVVGDEDQSIYRFRGADIGNILSFQKDFPGASVIKLTQNYRSTSAILDAANNLVKVNTQRIGKDLWTDAGAGEPVRFTLLPGDREEASFVVAQIQGWNLRGALEDAAVLYRTNAQSRLFEEALVAARLPYRIYGSLRFYDRREVRDLIAYLKLAVNHADDVSLRRVAGVPPRGIGAVAMTAVEAAARRSGSSLHDAMAACARDALLPPRAASSARAFLATIAALGERAKTGSPAEILRWLVKEIDYEGYLRRTDAAEADSRLENVAQLITAAEEAGAEEGVQGFLDRASLVSETESVAGDRGVNLMTLHSAKGLEFDVVFLVGLEEGLLPHSRTLEGEEEIEEERRLCYVGLTRARRRLHLTAAGYRRLYGEPLPATISRFVDEIGEDHLERGAAPSMPYAGIDRHRRRREVPLGEEDISPHHDDDGDDPSGFGVGARVRHEQFGVGQILAVEPVRDGQKLTVRFAGGRTMKVLTRYAHLTRVGA